MKRNKKIFGKIFGKKKKSKNNLHDAISVSSESKQNIIEIKPDKNNEVITNWENIHPAFAKWDYYETVWAGPFDYYQACYSFSRTYQWAWEEEAGLTYQDAQEWIAAGFEPADLWEVKKWKKLFTPQQTKSWKDIGLKSNLNNDDTEFAAYLRWKGHQPDQDLNLEQSREEFNTWKTNPPAQEYLDAFYLPEQRNNVKNLSIRHRKLTGHLDLNDFINLEELECFGNQLTSLNLDNCLNLKKLDCSNNQLTELKVNYLINLAELECSINHLVQLDLTNCDQLEKLSCSNNNLQRLEFPSRVKQLTCLDISNNNFPEQDLFLFSRLVNLGGLYLYNNSQKKGIYNRFFGSLEPLQNLTKLEYLDISNTDINSGLEYLPESVEKFYCSASQRPEAKCKAIYNLFANEKGEVETEYGRIKNFLQKLQAWKEANPELVNNVQQIIKLERILNNLNLALINGKIENKNISQGLDIFQFETEERIIDMKKQNQEYYQAQILHNPPKNT